MKIIRNAIRCNLCGDEIESTDRHQYVTCSCGACAVDGGHDYLWFSKVVTSHSRKGRQDRSHRPRRLIT